MSAHSISDVTWVEQGKDAGKSRTPISEVSLGNAINPRYTELADLLVEAVQESRRYVKSGAKWLAGHPNLAKA